VLRTRPPRSTPERVRARLACIRHAASVDPEPGSNSPPKTLPCPKTPPGPLTLARLDACASGLSAESSDSVESHRLRSRTFPLAQKPALRVMATRCIWLTCCCWASRSNPGPRASPKAHTSHQHPPLAPSSAHDTRTHSPLFSRMLSPPSAAPACQRAAPRDVATSARLLRHRRFTRSIRPPVPQSGVAPHRSPQSLPCLPSPCQGSGPGPLRSAFPSEGTHWSGDPDFLGRRSVSHPATLGTLSVYYDTTTMSSRMPSGTKSTRPA
jgi:hypothetical protein